MPAHSEALIRHTNTRPVCLHSFEQLAHPGGFRRVAYIVVGGGSRPSVSTSSSPIASASSRVQGRVSLLVSDLAVFLRQPGVEALVPGLGISGALAGERFRAGQPLEHTTSARMRRQQEIASKCRDPVKG